MSYWRWREEGGGGGVLQGGGGGGGGGGGWGGCYSETLVQKAGFSLLVLCGKSILLM